MSVDFLPVCDLLFNFVSVTFYFCDIAFDVLVLKECYELTNYQGENPRETSNIVPTSVVPLLVTSMLISLFTCQMISLKWYFEESNKKRTKDFSPKDWAILLLHICQCSVLWRYTKLLIKPLAIRNVKSEMRNLCILRMIHSLCQSIFFLLIQGHLLLEDRGQGGLSSAENEENRPTIMVDVHYISMSFNIINICWSLASFNKNIQRKDVEKLVLTWIGVMFQFVWRLGTVSSRCLALILYWSSYENWILCVVALHWLCVFLSLIVPNKIFAKEEAMSTPQWILKCFVLSYIYVFCYLNLDKSKTKTRMALFYSLILVENILLVCLWSVSIRTTLEFSQQEKLKVFCIVIASFVIGIIFMLLYYKYFHATKLGPIDTHEFAVKGRQTKLNFSNDICSSGANGGSIDNQINQNSSNESTMNHQTYNNHHHPHHHQQAVFNCVLPHQMQSNTKKKKMPSILPPPPTVIMSTTSASKDTPTSSNAFGQKAKTPFWKEPLPSNSALVAGMGGRNSEDFKDYGTSSGLYYNDPSYADDPYQQTTIYSSAGNYC